MENPPALGEKMVSVRPTKSFEEMAALPQEARLAEWKRAGDEAAGQIRRFVATEHLEDEVGEIRNPGSLWIIWMKATDNAAGKIRDAGLPAVKHVTVKAGGGARAALDPGYFGPDNP
jgi:hypothetical protein